MSGVLLASADRHLVDEVRAALHAAGVPLRVTHTWDGLVRELTRESHAVLLVDGEMPGLRLDLLVALRESLAQGPELLAIRGTSALPEARLDRLTRQLARRSPGALTQESLKELGLLGFGQPARPILAHLAASPLPLRLEGERGTGKLRVARAVHHLAGAGGPLRVIAVGTLPDFAGPPGTVYLRHADRWEPAPLMDLHDACREAGWRLMGGARSALGPETVGPPWHTLALPPLRQRPDDLQALTLLYVDRYRRRLGMVRRRFDRDLWALVRAHRWPGNVRELETFVVQALTSTAAPVVKATALPERVRTLVEPSPAASMADLARAFEDVVEARLAPIVLHGEVAGNLELHRLAVEATERALLRLALVRTGGNQKAAAELVGVARNTLASKLRKLGLATGAPR